MADSDHLVGPLVFTVAVISMAEVVRAGRFLNALLGLWIIAAAWLLSGATLFSTWNSVLVGVAVVVLSFPRGRIHERYGRWDNLNPRKSRNGLEHHIADCVCRFDAYLLRRHDADEFARAAG